MITAAAIGVARALERQQATQAKVKAAKEADQKDRPRVYRTPTKGQVAVINNTAEKLAVPGAAAYKAPIANGARVLDMMEGALNTYMRFEKPEYARIIAAWIAHTYFVDEESKLMLPFSPRLFLVADPGSGKTRLMEMLASLAYGAIGPLSGVVTSPSVRNAMDKHRTPLLDEVHRYIQKYDMQGLANSYTSKGISLNALGGGLNAQTIYAPMALAGIKDKLFNSRLYETIEDLFTRCFVVELKKHKPKKNPVTGEVIDPLPQLDQTFEAAAEFARNMMGFWGAQQRPDDPDDKLWPLFTMPDDLTGRNLDLATALCAVADRAVDIRDVDDDGTPMTDERRYRWANQIRQDCVAVLTDAGKVADLNQDLDKYLAMFSS